jgi:hypothetical protein
MQNALFQPIALNESGKEKWSVLMMESDYSGNIVIVPPEEDTIAPLV